MLIGIISVLSLCLSALTCLFTNAFTSLRWLWQLPVTFLGGFLFLALCWFIMMNIMAMTVNMKKEQEEDSPFFRTVITLTVDALVAILRIRIHTEGLDKMPKDGRVMLVCNHLHETDPVILLWAFRKKQLAFISKQEADSRYLVGPFLRKILCQPINRENDREALKTIIKCIKLLKEDKVSLGVFPEGYCSKDFLLRRFRSGVFKIAQKTEVPIVVCTIRGTQNIFHNILRLKPTHVTLHLVDIVSPDSFAGRTTVDIGQQVYDIMAEDLGPALVYQEDAEG